MALGSARGIDDAHLARLKERTIPLPVITDAVIAVPDTCKPVVTMLVERGTTVPEEKLLTMTVEELFALASAKVR